MEAGQRSEALKHADAALALDPAFLAAQTLRERIVASGATVAPRPIVPHAVEAAAAVPAASAPINPRSVPARQRTAAIRPSIATAGPVVPPAQLPAPPPPRASEALTQFEARARQRRLERRVAAAQHSLAAGQLADARVALEEVRELDATHPELASLLASLDAAERPAPAPVEQAEPRKPSRLRPWMAGVAAALAGLTFAAYRVERSAPPDLAGESAPVSVAVTAPAVVSTTGGDAPAVDAAPLPIDTSSPAPADAARIDPARVDAPVVEPAAGNAARVSAPPAVAPTFDPPAGSPVVRSVTEAPRPLPQAPVPAPADTVASVLPAVAVAPPPPPQPRFDPSPSLGIPADMPREFAAAPIPPPPAASAARAPAPAASNIPTRSDDTQLVRELLQRYRSAYQELSAAHARAIWPAVNEPALQRAFEGLESQTLTFNTCDVQLRGGSATATCRGTAEYVPKVGSREPHVEPRVWNFTLQKTGEAWQIQTARTER